MPTYGYKCLKCESTFEIFQKVNESPITVCPECGGETSRIFYPVGIIFKGPGFHITDYCRPKEEKGKTPKTKPVLSKVEGKETSKTPDKEKSEKAS